MVTVTGTGAGLAAPGEARDAGATGAAPTLATREAAFEASDARVDRSVRALGGQLDRSLAALPDAGAAAVADAVVDGTAASLPTPDGGARFFDEAGRVADELQRAAPTDGAAAPLANERAAVGRELERLVDDGAALAAADPSRALEIQRRIDAAVDGVERTVQAAVEHRFSVGFDPMRASMEGFGLTAWAALPPLTQSERHESGRTRPEFPVATRAWRDA